MNLKDAVASGRRWRRKGCEDWHYALLMNHQDAIADDWEVEPLPEPPRPLPLLCVRCGQDRFYIPEWNRWR
jgi:hypothetical protein